MFSSSRLFLKDSTAQRAGFVRAFVPASCMVLFLVVIEGLVLTALGLRSGGVLPYDSQGSNIIGFAAIEGTSLGLCAIRHWGDSAASGYHTRFTLIDLCTGRPADLNRSGVMCLDQLPGFQEHLGSPVIEWMHGTSRPERVLLSDFQEREDRLPRPHLVYCEDLDTMVEYDTSLIAWSVHDSRRRWTAHLADGAPQSVAIGAHSLFCGTSSGVIVELDLATGAQRNVFRAGSLPIARLAASPCGSYLAVVTLDGCLHLHDNRNQRIVWTQHAATVTFTPHFLDDGQSIVTLHPSDRRRLSIVNVSSGQVQQELGTHRGVLGAFSNPGLNRIFTWGMDGELMAWDPTNGSLDWTFSAAGDRAWL